MTQYSACGGMDPDARVFYRTVSIVQNFRVLGSYNRVRKAQVHLRNQRKKAPFWVPLRCEGAIKKIFSAFCLRDLNLTTLNFTMQFLFEANFDNVFQLQLSFLFFFRVFHNFQQ